MTREGAQRHSRQVCKSSQRPHRATATSTSAAVRPSNTAARPRQRARGSAGVPLTIRPTRFAHPGAPRRLTRWPVAERCDAAIAQRRPRSQFGRLPFGDSSRRRAAVIVDYPTDDAAAGQEDERTVSAAVTAGVGQAVDDAG